MIPTTDATIARVRAFADVRGWKPGRFAKEAGLSVNALRDFNDPNWQPNVATLRALEVVIPADFTAEEAAA